MQRQRFSRKGFTLIELSIVLIIIGLLLGAVIKGRDLIRSAEIKKFYNGFIKQWELIYNNYYDRTGKVLGGPLVVKTGDQNNPVYVEYNEFVGTDLEHSGDFIMRAIDKYKIVDANNVSDSNGWIINCLIAAGLEVPKGERQYANIYDLTATKVGKTMVVLLFGSDPAVTNDSIDAIKEAVKVVNNTPQDEDGNSQTTATTIPGKGDGRGNFMLLVNVPFDVAAQIDKIIDDKIDAQNGRFICVKAYVTAKTISDLDDISNIIDTSVEDLNSAKDCGGPFGWGGGLDSNSQQVEKYVTALYKLEF